MTPSKKIDQLIEGLNDWRGKTLAEVRKSFVSADKGVIEEWKWMGSPVWECDGMIAVANAHKDKVKVTFLHGARVADPDRIFNAGLDGGKWRAIDFSKADKVDNTALKNLVRGAIEYNRSKLKKKSTPKKTAARKKAQPRKIK